MSTEVVMPQMGESIAEGTITKWLVKLGDRVERDQPLFEITTDKVDAEIPSPVSGTVVEIRHQEGETVEVETVVALIDEAGGEPLPATEARSSQGPQPQPSPGVPAAASTGEVVRPFPQPPAASPGPAGPAHEPAALKASQETRAQPGGGAGAQVVSLEERLRRFSSPVVRNIAAKEGVDLAQLTGTGIQGRVTKGDILAYLEQRRQSGEVETRGAGQVTRETPEGAPSQPQPPGPLPEYSVAAYSASENVTIEPMSKIREITAAHMRYSKATSAHVTTVFHVDMSRVVHLRNLAKDAFARQNGTKLTYMPFIFQAVVSALRAYPKFNASIDGNQVVYKHDINLGMAVALDRGLIVPVIRNADQLSLIGLATKANDLADRARAKQLRPDEVQGGTFTVTNPGVYGGLFGTPIINQPQVAILCIGTIEKRPVVVTDDDGNDALAIKTMSYFAMTYDHRLIDGADAERCLVHIRRSLAEGEWSELSPYLN